MENKAKPRICEVLEVEVGESFTADYPYKDLGKMEVREDGNVACGTGKVRSNALCYMINHPECIHKIHYWTPEEVEIAKAIKLIFSTAKSVRRKEHGLSEGLIEVKDEHGAFLFPSISHRFPSLKSGEVVLISDIIGGEENG